MKIRNEKWVFLLMLVAAAAAESLRSGEPPKSESAPASRSADGEKYPKDFVDAARAFKSAPATNRFDAGAKLMEVLPTTPVISGDGPIDYSARESRFIVRDYSKPSFVLTESEAIRMLGSPWWTNSSGYSYLIQVRGTNNLQTFLHIEFYNDHAVFSFIY